MELIMNKGSEFISKVIYPASDESLQPNTICDGDTSKINFFKTADLNKQYRLQLTAMHDARLDNVTIAVVPDAVWTKGRQVSESDAGNMLILFKESYFRTHIYPDKCAWMTHELAHCQYRLNCKTEKFYQKKLKTYAYTDLQSNHPYPNNLVEQYAFAKQFQFLQKQGIHRVEIHGFLKVFYSDEDFIFFDRLLDEIFE